MAERSASPVDRRGAWLALLLLATGAMSCSEGDADPMAGRETGGAAVEAGGPVTVLAAASLTDAMEALARQFEAETGITVRISNGPSSGLARQVITGAPADVFVSASLQWAEELEQAGLVERSVPLLRNRMVLAVPRGNPADIRHLADLARESISYVAIAGETVPAGIYAGQALAAAGLLETLRKGGKIVRGHDVRLTLSHVVRGEVDAGLVYRSDAMLTPEVEVVELIAETLHEPIVYPVVLLRERPAGEAGRRFFDYLQSDAAEREFEAAGFTMAAPHKLPPANPATAPAN